MTPLKPRPGTGLCGATSFLEVVTGWVTYAVLVVISGKIGHQCRFTLRRILCCERPGELSRYLKPVSIHAKWRVTMFVCKYQDHYTVLIGFMERHSEFEPVRGLNLRTLPDDGKCDDRVCALKPKQAT